MTNAASDKLLEEKTRPSEPPLPVLQGDTLPSVAIRKHKAFRFLLVVHTLAACGITLMALRATVRSVWLHLIVLRHPGSAMTVFTVGVLFWGMAAWMWYTRGVTKRLFDMAKAEL